jgi:hypothetical protein
VTATSSNLEERARLLELEAELQRKTLRASFDTLHGAKGITWALAGASLASRLAIVHKAKVAGYALIAARLLFRARRVLRDRKRLPR